MMLYNAVTIPHGVLKVIADPISISNNDFTAHRMDRFVASAYGAYSYTIRALLEELNGSSSITADKGSSSSTILDQSTGEIGAQPPQGKAFTCYTVKALTAANPLVRTN